MFLSYGREEDSSAAKEVNSLYLNRQFLTSVGTRRAHEPLSFGALLDCTFQIRNSSLGKRNGEHHLSRFLHHHRDVVEDGLIVGSYVQCLTNIVSSLIKHFIFFWKDIRTFCAHCRARFISAYDWSLAALA